jgi:hypothetical protein
MYSITFAFLFHALNQLFYPNKIICLHEILDQYFTPIYLTKIFLRPYVHQIYSTIHQQIVCLYFYWLLMNNDIPYMVFQLILKQILNNHLHHCFLFTFLYHLSKSAISFIKSPPYFYINLFSYSCQYFFLIFSTNFRDNGV